MSNNIKNAFLIGIAILGSASGLYAQQGYIYVHTKALDESSSPNFTYAVSGGPTAAPGFTLNDQPAQLQVGDLGAAQNGRLWAVGRNNQTLYYRDLNSGSWIATAITNARDIDGGQNGDVYYINTAGQVRKTSDGTTSVAISGNIDATDIGSGWDDRPYIITTAGAILRYDGAGSANTDWTTFSTSATLFSHVDVNPASGAVYVTASNGANNFTYRLTPNTTNGNTEAAAPVSLGRGGASGLAVNDIAVNEQGEVFTVMAATAGGGWGVYKWTSGTSWTTQEVTSLEADRITGGLGNQMWITKKMGGILSTTVPFFNIYSRSLSGSTIAWIDDERVHTTPAGNSAMIPVAAGTYTITQASLSGWDLQDILLLDPSSNSTGSISARTATVNVVAGEVVHVIFQNGIINPFTMTNSCSNVYTENFGSGAVGTFGSAFVGQTSYHYIGNSVNGEDGFYKIVSTAFPDFNTWQAAPFYDHTTGNGTGRMFAVNAGFDRNEFFRRRFVGVIPGATYDFSAWLANLTPGGANIKPNVSFRIVNPADGTILAAYGTGDMPSTPTAWLKYGMSFVATTSEIDLVMVNNTIGGNGNDLAIDDIVFKLSPPASLVIASSAAVTNGSGTITVSAPTGSTIEYSLDNITYQSSPVFAGLTAGIYNVYARFTTTPDCITQGIDTINTVLSGSIFNDADGLSDNSVDGTPLTSAISGGPALYVSLYNGTTLIQTVPVNPATGTYQFGEVPPNTTYTINVGTNSVANPVSAFSGSGSNGWVATGESCCGTTTGDGLANGSKTISVGTAPVSGVNFGLEQRPLSNNVSQSVPYPTGGIIAPGTVITGVSGTDPEQGTLSGSNTPVVITVIPANATMYYNGVQVHAGDTITNFNASLLSFNAIANGATQVSFSYSFYDQAGMKSLVPGVFNMNWGTPLPIVLSTFDARKQEHIVVLDWQTASEQNNKGFGIERSADGKVWNELGFVATLSVDGNSMTPLAYTFSDSKPLAGINYYRLKQTASDNKFVYSAIRQVHFGTGSTIAVFPNPISRKVTVSGLKGDETMYLFNLTGQRLLSLAAAGNSCSLDLQPFASGAYIIVIADKSGAITGHFRVLKK